MVSINTKEKNPCTSACIVKLEFTYFLLEMLLLLPFHVLLFVRSFSCIQITLPTGMEITVVKNQHFYGYLNIFMQLSAVDMYNTEGNYGWGNGGQGVWDDRSWDGEVNSLHGM